MKHVLSNTLSRRFLWCVALVTAGCSAGEGGPPLPVEPAPGVPGGDDVDTVIGDTDHEFHVISQARLGAAGDVIPVHDALATGLLPGDVRIDQAASLRRRSPAPDSLVIGYPVRLLGEEVVFGGVVTRVETPLDPAFGVMKLSYLLPVHVRPFLASDPNAGDALVLMGCELDCSERSPQQEILAMPALGVDHAGEHVFLDTATLGEGLGLSAIYDDLPALGLAEVESRVTFVDYSSATLVFDVESELVPTKGLLGASGSAPETMYVTIRWYLKLGSGFHAAFEPRARTAEFGHEVTYRAARPPIMRFATTQHGNHPPVKYYVKNVPPEYRGAVSAAFDDWNQAFRDVLGHDLLDHEHLDPGDPRHAAIVMGDARYNVIEWDLDPLELTELFHITLAHQHTGEVFSGAIELWGPEIVRQYQGWFRVHRRAAALRAAGDRARAEEILAEAQREDMERAQAPRPRLQLHLGRLALEAPGASAEAAQGALPVGFYMDPPPPDQTFATFIQGFLRGRVSFALGANLGLSHNFLGTLSGDGVDTASHSIMDVIPRVHGHLARVGPYDQQAIAYSYTGTIAEDPLPSCQYNVNILEPTLSAECTYFDGGPDPFAYFRDLRLARSMDLLIGRGLGARPPVWMIWHLFSPFQTGLRGMAYYATSAEATSDTWLAFHRTPGRPTEPAEIRQWVIDEIQGTLCNTSIRDEVLAKYALAPEAGLLARQGWADALLEAQFVGERLELPIGACALFDELPF